MKIKMNEKEMGLLAVFGIIFIIFAIWAFSTLLAPNPYEDLNRLWSEGGKDNYMKYWEFEDKRMSNAIIAWTGTLISGPLMFIPLGMHGKRKQEIEENYYYQYLLTLSPKELEIEKIKVLQQQNNTTQLLILSLFL